MTRLKMIAAVLVTSGALPIASQAAPISHSGIASAVQSQPVVEQVGSDGRGASTVSTMTAGVGRAGIGAATDFVPASDGAGRPAGTAGPRKA